MQYAHVTNESDIAPVELHGALATVRVTIDRSVGCQNLTQRVIRYREGRSAEKLLNEISEEVFYVLSGHGVANVGGRDYQLLPDTAMLVPPGTPYVIDNTGPEELALLSVLAPQPGQAVGEQVDAKPDPDRLVVDPNDEEPISAGPARWFKLLIDPRYGCRNLTQFMGVIDTSRAVDHTHTYEEVIYIIDGSGIVNAGGESHPIQRGSCVYLSPGTQHCLENPNEEPLRLVGVFCPAGSPASHQDVGTG